MQTTLYQGLSCLRPNISVKFQPGHIALGVPNRGGVDLDWRFSTNISLYLKNGAR